MQNLDKNSFLKMLGKLPQKVPLDIKILEETDAGKYIRQKIEYSSEAGERIRAYVGVPKNIQGRVPAIFCHHQHAGNWALGKSEVFGLDGDINQSYAHELSELGYITFAPDAIGFEERAVGNADAISAIQLLLFPRGLFGQTLLGKCLFDISAGIDYLSLREDVDSSKIGFIGHSYGGRMALWAPAFDSRIKASVSNCGCITQKLSLERGTGIQFELFVFGMLNYGDVPDVVKLANRTALYISATDNDKWSFGAQELYNEVKSSFQPDMLDFKLWSGKHVFTSEMRQAAYNFLIKKLS